MHTPPSFSGPRSARNANTWLASAFAHRPPNLNAAYELALGLAANAPSNVVGHRLFWVHGASFGATDLPAADGIYKIVGRHTHADVSIEGDPRIGLRHLVLRSVRTAEGENVLRVLDLHTALGFAMADGVVRRSIVARGPVALAVGDYALVALPSGELPKALPSPFFEEMSGPYRSPGRRPFGTSHIGILPGISELGDFSAMSGKMHAFSLERPWRGRETVLVSDAELERGVVVGRSPKAHPQILQLMDNNVSRMHILLVRDGTETYAIDLCSMNGTWVGFQRIRRIRLAQGMMVRFGDCGQVSLQWHGAV